MPFHEPLTGADGTITMDHAYIHQGIAYSLSVLISALGAGSDYKIGFRTPTATEGKYIHWRPAMFASSANYAQYKLYEGSIYSGGTLKIPTNRNRNISKYALMKTYDGVTAALTGVPTITTKAGGNFGNQPAGGKVTVVSSDDADKLMTLTVYGTKTGSTTTVTSETIILNGTTGVDSVLATWQNILGIELSAVCAGTVTLKNAGAATITTISAAALSSGIGTPTVSKARNQILNIVASGATTMPMGVIGTTYDGTAITSVAALNGNTAKALNASIFNAVTKVLIGAVESARTVTVTIPDKILSQFTVGVGATSSRAGGSGGSELEWVLEPDTDYVVYFKNSGAATATDIDADIMFYEEEKAVA